MNTEKPWDNPELRARLANVRLLAMDVDGVLTDGTLAYGDSGETKNFHTADGLGLTALRMMGYTIAWISGRGGGAVKRRADELQIPHLITKAGNKGQALLSLMRELGLEADQVAYIGDDWNDIPAFSVAGIAIAVANANADLTARADVVTRLVGGQGAVREVCDALLDATGRREAALEAYLEHLDRLSTYAPVFGETQ